MIGIGIGLMTVVGETLEQEEKRKQSIICCFCIIAEITFSDILS